jgi:L-aminopeptidase/D-esterase-like protein
METYKGCITDIEGLLAGHYTDFLAKTGCTVVVCPEGAVCGADVRGGAPGTRETDLLKPGMLVQKVHAVLLTGGSAFGLNAAGGVMQYLEEKHIGMETEFATVPIVPAAVIYDLGIGRSGVRPDKAEGYAAAAVATKKALPQGSYGAGTGALIGKLMGMKGTAKGGVGAASIDIGGGVKVAAVFVVNALGDVCDHRTGRIIAGLQDEDGQLLNSVNCILQGAGNGGNSAGQNTTIGIVATNAVLTKDQAYKMASMAHDGIALAVRPAHTLMDGDTVFALSTCKKEAELTAVFTAAAEVTARAIVNACLLATAGE